jgi:hypothetical protein
VQSEAAILWAANQPWSIEAIELDPPNEVRCCSSSRPLYVQHMTDPALDEKYWGGRRPRVESLTPNEDQRSAIETIQKLIGSFKFATTDSGGRLIGPFNALALRPELGMAFIQWAASNERESLLPKVIRELVILTVGTAWDSDYEL